MKPNDGGPAFPAFENVPGYGCSKPVVGTNGEIYFENHSPGMSLRDYFIAHAPAEPQPWFEPKLPPCPKPDPAWHWCEGCKGDGNCDHNAQCDQLREVQKQHLTWKADAKKAQYVQWPAAWADEMLKAREQC